jgi:hypothetical protein
MLQAEQKTNPAPEAESWYNQEKDVKKDVTKREENSWTTPHYSNYRMDCMLLASETERVMGAVS